MLVECDDSDFEDEDSFDALENPYRCKNLVAAVYKMKNAEKLGFVLSGEIFYFRELSPKVTRKWFNKFFSMAANEPGRFREILALMFMRGLHPKDCFARGSPWVERIFQDGEPQLDNKRIDDLYAWAVLKCRTIKPSGLDNPSEEDEDLIDSFIDDVSLDILQKAVNHWLNAGTEEIQSWRIQTFREAMEADFLCEAKSNKGVTDLIAWLDGCEMGHSDTIDNPAQAARRDNFEKALWKLMWYRYPRSTKFGASQRLRHESYYDRDEDDDDLLVNNEIPGLTSY